jgi:hypothetical protein
MKIYKASVSFDQANSIAQSIIMPMTQIFDRQEIEDIVHGGFENRQIRYSNEFSTVLAALKVNKSVDSSWWDPLLKAQKEDAFLADLFFVPLPPEVEEQLQTDI